jgi:mono/diheme cytochrome c family protein
VSQCHEAVERARDDASNARGARSILALIVAGLTSFGLAGAVGWSVGGLRGSERVPVADISPPRTSAGASTGALGQGDLLFQVQCARCHGTSGRGDGPDVPLLKSRPRDFSQTDKDQARDPNLVRKAIADGVPRTPMNGFAQMLSAREIDLLVERVLSFSSVGRPGGTADRSQDSVARYLERAEFAPAPKRGAAPLELRDKTGETLSLDQLRGRLVLVAFWGTTCRACLEELPDLDFLAERYRDRGLSVLAVCVEQAAPGEAFQVAQGRVSHLKVYTDSNGLSRLGYDIQALPTAVLIDPLGNVLGRAEGAKNWSSAPLRKLIEACLPGVEAGSRGEVAPGS